MINRESQLQQLFSEGSALLQTGNALQALNCFQRAQEIDPSNPTLHLYIGAALHDLKRFDEAIIRYEKALQIAPRMGEAHNNLGNSLIALGLFTDAAESFTRASKLLESSPVPLAARSTALQALGKIAEAEADCRTALALDPTFAAAHWNLALNLLLQGRYEEGWQEYEWRWQKPDFTSPVRHNDIPLWDGSPLDGRTILLHAEQGFGDAIQFVRYVPMVAKCGGKIVLECHPQLVPLFQGIQGVFSVVAFGEDLPVCECQAPFLTLPRIFATTLETIPACSSILVPVALQTKWQQRISSYSGPKVGIAWAGSTVHHNDCFRSLPLPLLSSLATCTDINFFSLQMGNAKRQLELSPLANSIIDLTDHIDDFADTAALIEQLDLIISVDTAVAHLAGILGKPVLLLVAFAPDWRWLFDRSDSPWYPTLHIFRQKQPGDWDSVIDEVKSALSDLQRKNEKSFEAAAKD
ncbi:MAG: tetratricopeptide repeat protein [Desulfuromonadaceae bacterium]|nr:tetratricopeptide repeat protein [Desulfuromonadaceae bacterium]MDD2849549.1 tetratricopeptide repeat protein [Desulfuromonadaceae bacterium]MDD4131975.1 tetratricopeptide repeat protein [Desulfuromonadaceae bacterium]